MQIIFENSILNKREGSCTANFSPTTHPLLFTKDECSSSSYLLLLPFTKHWASHAIIGVEQNISSPSPPPFFFHLVLNDLQKKTTRSVSLILGSSCRLVLNRSTNSSSQWTCLELQFCFEMKSLITDSFSKGVVY